MKFIQEGGKYVFLDTRTRKSLHRFNSRSLVSRFPHYFL